MDVSRDAGDAFRRDTALMDLSAPTVIVPDPVAALSTAGTSSLPVSVTVESPANARLAVSATSAASAACTVFMIQLLCGCGRMLAEALVRFEAISGVRRRDDEARRGRIGFDFLAQSIDELLEHALLDWSLPVPTDGRAIAQFVTVRPGVLSNRWIAANSSGVRRSGCDEPMRSRCSSTSRDTWPTSSILIGALSMRRSSALMRASSTRGLNGLRK
jgi:hypothetical protein